MGNNSRAKVFFMTNLSISPLTQWSAPLGLPDYTAFTPADYGPAFDAAMAEHRAEIAAIAAETDAPSIDNTLLALELSGENLSRISAIFWGLTGANTNPDIQKLERELAPKLSAHYTAIGMNAELFDRLDALYQARDHLGLDAETRRVLEKSWKGFVRSGAKLGPAEKQRLAEINGSLAKLGTNFGQNILKDEAEWALMLKTEAELEGLPPFLRDAMKSAAISRDQPEAWAVTLSRSIIEPFLALSARRELREAAYKAFVARGENLSAAEGDADNRDLVAETLALRQEKAKLLGYRDYAAYKLEHTMAGSADQVFGLLEPVWVAARKRAGEEQAALQKLINEEGGNHDVAPWDWRYYAEKQRTMQFNFDEAELKPYLQLNNIIAASFDVAGRLFGLKFEEQPQAKAWHEDARVWTILNADGSQRGLFIGDYFNRPSKRSGAWMSALRSQHKLGAGQQPIIYNVMNFAKPAAGQPALLSLDDARTLFHEFGHALHGMLSDVTWPSVSGTSVYRDFVELPSQLYEHWLTVPEILQHYAVHAETGEPMPKALLDKVLAAGTFNSGFQTVEFTSSALIDMYYHTQSDAPQDAMAFEAEMLEKLEMPDAIAMRHRTPHFQHVFAGDGYSAGYYSYLWSEVLDADAFAAFEEAGDPFDKDLAHKLKTHIYAAGGAEEPEALYTAFRGRMPTADAMMKGRGLV